MEYQTFVSITCEIVQLVSISCLTAASYLWIRIPIWQSTNSISQLSQSASVPVDSVVRNLVSQRSDSRVAFCLILLGSFFQLVSLILVSGVIQWYFKVVLFAVFSLSLYRWGHLWSRKMERRALQGGK